MVHIPNYSIFAVIWHCIREVSVFSWNSSDRNFSSMNMSWTWNLGYSSSIVKINTLSPKSQDFCFCRLSTVTASTLSSQGTTWSCTSFVPWISRSQHFAHSSRCPFSRVRPEALWAEVTSLSLSPCIPPPRMGPSPQHLLWCLALTLLPYQFSQLCLVSCF